MTKNKSEEGAGSPGAAHAAQPGSLVGQQPGDAPPLHLVAAKLTDVGRARDHNEDYVGIYVPPDAQQLARKGIMYAVADGMGGHQAGEVASQGAVELAIGQYYSDTNLDVGASLVRAFRAANRLIHEQSQADPDRSGMGTTLVAAVVLGRKVYVASVGDSRAYLINGGGIRQITEDHSWVVEQVRMGLLTPEDARHHPQRNVVTRALGSRPTVEVDLFEGEIGEGDYLLLCTDGVTGHLEDHELAVLVQSHPPEEAVRQIVAQANERGGKDNMGLIIVGAARPKVVPAPAAAPAGAAPRRRMSPLVGVLAAVAVIAVLAAAGLGGWWLASGRSTPTADAAASDTAIPGETAATPASVAADLSPTPDVQATATAPLAPAATEGAPLVPEATGGSPVGPTSTLAVTDTPGAPSQPSPTRQTPQPRPSETGSTGPTPTPYPAAVLVVPAQDEELVGTVEFRWQWDHAPLQGAYFLDLRIWSEVEDSAGHEPRGVVPLLRDTHVQVDLEGVQSIKEYRDQTANFYWAVVVVRKPCPDCKVEIAGQWSEKRPFIYGGPPSP
ncbi:MAG: Stp1/IreP family PP2C-type Ser/Thr phosphatase [Anaerolineae bacterium]